MPIPAISVAMSVYNGERFLAPAIESVLTQEFGDFEFLIVDDGSTDTSAQIIRHFAQRDPRIRPILRANKGLVASLNEMIETARAPIVARMDADDICRPERFGRQYDFLNRHPDYGVVSSWTEDIDADGRPHHLAGKEQPDTFKGFLDAIEHGWPLLCHPSAMMRRDVVLSVGGYHAAFRHCEDYDLWLRLASVSRLVNIPERLLRYRHHDNQVSSRHATEQQVGAAISYFAYRERREGRPDPTASLDRLPPIDELDALFGRKGVAAQVRARVAPNLLYSPFGLRDQGFDLLCQFVRDGGDRAGMWRTVARLLSLKEPLRAIRLATVLARSCPMERRTTPRDRASTPVPAMSVRTAAVWAMAGQYIGFAIQFVSSVIISRLFLSPGEVGLFSIALAAALLVAVLQDFGLSRYISGLREIDDQEVRRCSSVALLFSLLVVAVICAAAWPLAHLYALPALAPLLVIIASSYLFLPLAVVPMALLAREMRFDRHFAINLGGAAVQAGVAITLAALGYSAFALAWATVGAGLARGLIAQGLRPAPPWPLRFDRLGEVMGFGTRSSALYMTGALGTRTPDLILGKLVTLTAVGLYSRAASLSDQFRTLISGAIGSVFFPAFSRIRDRGDHLGPPYLRVCAGYSAVVWPGMAGLALASQPIVRLLYGEHWADVAPLLTMISLAEILLVALPLVSDIPIVLGRMNRLLAYNIVDTLLSLVLLGLGAWWAGVEGAAGSRIVYAAGWLAIYARFMHGLVKFDVRALAAIYTRSALATVAAVAPLALVYAFVSGPASIGFALLLCATGLGALCWLAALALLRHPALDEILTMAAPLRRRLARAA